MRSYVGYDRSYTNENMGAVMQFKWDSLKCAGNGIMGCNGTVVRTVKDDYADDLTPIPLCRFHSQQKEWEGAETIDQRPRVILLKFCKQDKCGRVGRYWIVLGSKQRRFCLNHVAIHAEYTDVFMTNKYTGIRDVTNTVWRWRHGDVRATEVK